MRTFSDWNEPEPDYLEIDLVAHGGGTMAESFIHSLVVTDVCSGWTEAIPLLAREQYLVARGLNGVELVVSDEHQGLRDAIAAVFDGACLQRCRTHFMTKLADAGSKAGAALGGYHGAKNLRAAFCRGRSLPARAGGRSVEPVSEVGADGWYSCVRFGSLRYVGEEKGTCHCDR